MDKIFVLLPRGCCPACSARRVGGHPEKWGQSLARTLNLAILYFLLANRHNAHRFLLYLSQLRLGIYEIRKLEKIKFLIEEYFVLFKLSSSISQITSRIIWKFRENCARNYSNLSLESGESGGESDEEC